MPDFRPSRYIQHSDYATIKTYEPITASVSVPDSVVVGTTSDVVYYVDLNLPTRKGIGWRAIVISDKYDIGVNTPSFLVPCTATEMGSDYSTFFYGEVIRISNTKVRFQLVFSTAHLDTITYSECGQIFTIKLQPYLSPFEA